MMVKKSDGNSRALTLNETVGENYSPTSTYDESKEAWLEGWFAPGDTYMEAALLGLLF
jgi:hypothetical protein